MRPSDESWRADALGQSRHTRWLDELRAPLDDPDPQKAAEICGAVTRSALRDFAPALVLLAPAERDRARALAAYAITLFDFAHQPGLEGERLAQLNRMEFDLEAALTGEPRGQPVYVLMAAGAPWNREALDRIATSARSRIARPRPENDDVSTRDALELGGALAEALTGIASTGLAELGAGLIRLADLLGLAEALRRRRPRLPRTVLADDWLREAADDPALDDAILAECRAVERRLLAADLGGPSPTVRRAARYLRSVGLLLVRAVARSPSALLERPPVLGPIRRIALLARSLLP